MNVGTIVLQRMEKAQGATVSATNLNAPKDAKKAYDKGHHAIENNKLPEAQQELEKAVQLYPQYAAAWQDLGWVYAQQNQLDKARNAFTQAQAADGMFVPAYVGLSSVAVRESKWAEAADFSARATQLDGVDFPAAFFYNSLANYRLGNLEQAEKSARKAETLGRAALLPAVEPAAGHDAGQPARICRGRRALAGLSQSGADRPQRRESPAAAVGSGEAGGGAGQSRSRATSQVIRVSSEKLQPHRSFP